MYYNKQTNNLFNANTAISQPYHDENKLMFNKIMIRSALY